ncbi:hypothetical protein [Microvirga splendida]|uniref:Antitoxin VbhA domain-containing protein n=1 Tax=Microvirga splendida TaxID=2795727 RepID=A0ABS0Y3L1_9HYPH|nr:hypothetical protein [Microvirga splendida]MBJ6126896.1 hypothetical protein [Microvirga splendida]
MSAQDPDQPNEGGYSAEAISVLEGLERRRPWSLLATGEAAKALTPSVTKDIERIFELFPSIPFLTLHTAEGEGMVTRDYPSGYTQRVNAFLANIFEQNSEIIGITFPARDGHPAHTATRIDPFWSPDYKARAEKVRDCVAAILTERANSSQISVEEMKHRRKIVEQAQHNNLLAGITRDQATDPIFEAYIHGDIEATDIGRILERLSDLDKE